MKAGMERRPRGMGSVYSTQNGTRWMAVLTVHGKRRTKTVRTQEEAWEALSRLRIRYGSRLADDGTELIKSVGDIAERYFVWCKRQRRGNTYDSYKQAWNKHLKPELERVPIDELAPGDLDNFVFDKLDEGLAPSTVAIIMSALRGIYGLAVRDRIATVNPASLVSVPAGNRERQQNILHPTEIPRLIAACKTEFHGPAVITLVTTGLRIGELLGLKWRDLDFERGTLSVNRKVNYRKRSFEVETTKTNSGRRMINLPQVTLNALREHQEVCRGLKTDYLKDATPNDFVFRSAYNGAMLSPWVLRYRVLKRILSRAGLPYTRPHELRHATATFLLHQGESAYVVAGILGHKSVATTLTIYAHVMCDQNNRAAERFDRFFESHPVEQTE